MREQTIEPWGRIKKSKCETVQVHWPTDKFPKTEAETVLPYGMGRSYGDSCLNINEAVCLTRSLRLFENFDPRTGDLTCQGGTTLDEILTTMVPKGWFPPVVPGTKFITVGGAIANDIHGKNHHLEGTWGCHIKELTLLRSDRPEPVRCTPNENSDLFAATIGGLGLTGIILSATFRMKPISSSKIEMESIPFGSIEAFLEINEASSESPYTVAWIDLCAKGPKAGRGIYMRGQHATNTDSLNTHSPKTTTLPLTAPNWALNRVTVKGFNTIYRARVRKPKKELVHYNPFFFPLDSINGWNKIYGQRGFFQYQSVIPMESAKEATKKMLKEIAESKEGSFLAVMKTFGEIQSPGWLSFPQPGLTLALDFPNNGDKTLRLFERLDAILAQAGGRLYPAKDGRMRPESFQKQYPQWEKLEKLRDPKINSSFWRRVTTGGKRN